MMQLLFEQDAFLGNTLSLVRSISLSITLAFLLPTASSPLALLLCSVGSNMQYSFEEEAFDMYGSKPYTFDPFLKWWQNQHMTNLSFLHFRQIGLSASSELPRLAKKYPRKHFGSFQHLLELTGRSYVDILKVDCEGCEFKVLEELSEAYGGKRNPPIGQLTIEIHS